MNIGIALGAIQVERGSAIYLALEDTGRRLQKRMGVMLNGRKASEKLHLFTQWPRMPEGLTLLNAEMEKHPDLRLVVIDTFAKFKPLDNGGKSSSAYDVDYQHMADIKTVADKHGVAILMIHHLRKMESDDVFDTFSGTLGLTGAADGLLALVRKSGAADAELHVTGRDVEPAQYALSFVPEYLAWNIIGHAQEVQSTQQKQTLFDALKQYNQPISPKELADMTGLKGGYIRKALPSLVAEGTVKKVGRGNYIYIGTMGTTGTTGTMGTTGTTNIDCSNVVPLFPPVDKEGTINNPDNTTT